MLSSMFIRAGKYQSVNQTLDLSQANPADAKSSWITVGYGSGDFGFNLYFAGLVHIYSITTLIF